VGAATEGRGEGGRSDAAAAELGAVLGVELRDDDLARLSLTHRSYAFERTLGTDNERLEFLGDAVLGLVVTDLAFARFPDLSEGELAKLRAATVNMTTLADVARDLGLGELVLLGKGEEMSGGREKASILADVMEAVLGAVYLDGGLDAARELIGRLFWPRMLAYAEGEGERDYKTTLQELASQDLRSLPEYRIVERGPDHEKEFTATVYLGGKALGRGRGRSKKEAEQRAAREAFTSITRGDAGAEGG
jgi:ribonuclease-3